MADLPVSSLVLELQACATMASVLIWVLVHQTQVLGLQDKSFTD